MSPVEETRFDEAAQGEPGLSRHLYPASAMTGDYLRAAAGLVPSALLLATVPIVSIAGAVLGGFAAIFALFGLRTMMRHGMSIEIGENELRSRGPWPATIAWTELDRFRLAYYSTRRDRRDGWMQLELGAGRARLRLDSRIAGFDQVVRRAALAAAARGLQLNEATLANLQALGVRAPGLGRESEPGR